MSNQLSLASAGFVKTLQKMNPDLNPAEVSSLATRIMKEITIGLNNDEVPGFSEKKTKWRS